MQLEPVHLIAEELSGQERLLDQWDQQYQQMSAGRFRGELCQLDLGSIRLARERMNVAVDQQATPPKDWVAVSIPINGCRLLRCNIDNGVARGSGLHQVMTEGGRYRAISDQNSDIMVVMICRDFFETALNSYRLPDGNIRQVFMDISDRIATNLSHLLSAQHGKPIADADGMARHVLDQLANGRIITPSQAERSRQWRIDRQTIVRKACEAAEATGLESADLALMCDATGVSLRLIQVSFREVLGISPGRWLRLQRLNLARRRLCMDGEDNITRIALDLNFFHLGRFSQEYRQLFLETPSQTLRRTRGTA
ncbi:AraC family transcriptional regulator [Celeribacter neptunius]|uniref:AraC family transcriptional regulator, ethanolamine operon transcriptional activator n=1 Tax=Celeribacter neptunius TaxID=588602 RepID=A0A1I3TBH2_9RHOB|nr:AraC family transcriptional regulator [Celeribacter neptunius]SFJ67852.1 AraC family transcriptional regulator, ethanolamine operon transcriptional activator [Celeribacter neptunius]